MTPMQNQPQIPRERALWMLRKMRLVRQLSERIISLYPTDVMETPVHLCIGQEAVAAGVCAHLEDADTLFMGHRTHAPALCKGLPLHSLVAELYGRTTGCSHAKGGSMHLYDEEHGLLGSSAIVGGNIALGVGGALSSKLQGAEFISVSYFGDAATNAGVFYESLNFAALQSLPVLFLCENNGLSNVMPMSEHSAHDIIGVAAQFMPVYRADGTDARSVFVEAGQAIRSVREERAPVFLECRTKRWMKHQGHERDDLDYNPVDQEADCPIRKLEEWLLQREWATQADLHRIGEETEASISQAIRYAEDSPYPHVVTQEV
jgi:TPP-dependent pyruvate/acetoin dehydrogenase alpha subunit